VDVAIDKCEHIGDGVYDRAVTLSVAGVKFCVAKSIVTLHSTVCKELVVNKVSHTLIPSNLMFQVAYMQQRTLVKQCASYIDILPLCVCISYNRL
jgi:hypothetical protein